MIGRAAALPQATTDVSLARQIKFRVSSIMLNLEEIRKINEIFQLNGWDPKAKFLHNRKLNLFDAVSDFVAKIKPEHRKIVFELLTHYELIKEYNQYAGSLCDLLVADIDITKQYYVSPITLPDVGIIKSGHNFIYDVYSFFPRNKYKNVKFVDSPFSSDIRLDSATVMVFVDDFVGTGEQFFDMYQKLKNRFGTPIVSILLVIRIQEEAFINLGRAGIKVFADQVRKKAITSGRATGSMSIQQARDAYLQIENEVKVPYNASFGYGQAEAIVTMKRTPDNTLPIFWVDEGAGGQEWPAPFPRT